MRREAPEPPKTRVRDETLDILLDKADEAMDSLAEALHDLRVSVRAREHS